LVEVLKWKNGNIVRSIKIYANHKGEINDNFISQVCRTLEHEHIHHILSRLLNSEISSKFDNVSWTLEILDPERVLDGTVEPKTLRFLKKHGFLSKNTNKDKKNYALQQ
jgi:hypothetical protein